MRAAVAGQSVVQQVNSQKLFDWITSRKDDTTAENLG